MNKIDWEEQYPLNTLTGETKRELIAFITQLLTKEKEVATAYKNPTISTEIG